MKIDETISYIKRDDRDHSKEYALYRNKWNTVPFTHEVTHFPLNLDIEINTTCNLKCIECGFHSAKSRKDWKVKGDYMPLHVYKQIIDEGALHGLRAVKLNYRGEPLMHPNFIEMVKHAKKKGIIDVLINTNGLLLTPFKCRDILLSGVDEIAFSIDDHRAEIYEKIREGGSFARVYLNLITCKLQRDMLKSKTRIRVSRVNFPANHRQDKEFIEKFSPYCDSLGFQQYYDYTKIIDNATISDYCCAYPWQRMMILVDGTIQTCCNGTHPAKTLGHFPETSLYDAWHSKKFNAIRKHHQEQKTHLLPQCRACAMRDAFMFP